MILSTHGVTISSQFFLLAKYTFWNTNRHLWNLVRSLCRIKRLIEGKPPQVLYSHSTWYLPGACISAFFKLIFLFFVRFHLDSDLNKKKESFFGMRHAGGLRCGVPFILFFRFDVYWPLEAMKTVENDWCHLFGLSVLNLKHFSFLFGFSSNIVRCYVAPPVAFFVCFFLFFPERRDAGEI